MLLSTEFERILFESPIFILNGILAIKSAVRGRKSPGFLVILPIPALPVPNRSRGSLLPVVIFVTPPKPSNKPLDDCMAAVAVAVAVAAATCINPGFCVDGNIGVGGGVAVNFTVVVVIDVGGSPTPTQIPTSFLMRCSFSANRSCTVKFILPSDRDPRRFNVNSSFDTSSSSSSSSCTILHLRIRPV